MPDSLITDAVADALGAHAAKVPPNRAIVEIGAFKGSSTIALAAGAREGRGAHVWTVDPWDLAGNETGRFGFAEPSTREAFELRTANFRDQVTAIQGFSVDEAQRWEGPPVGLLFIDGDHRERSVREDFQAWEPYLVPGATVVFDDLDTPRNPGVRTALERLSLEWTIEAERLAVVRWLAK